MSNATIRLGTPGDIEAWMSLVRPVTVTTYREEAPNGAAARSFYRQLGFREGPLTEEFGAPVQEFILPRRDA